MKKLKIIQDTLMKNGRWSRTSLTMFFAFWLGVVYAFIALYKYQYDFMVFTSFMAVATGLKVIDVWDNKKNKPERDLEAGSDPSN